MVFIVNFCHILVCFPLFVSVPWISDITLPNAFLFCSRNAILLSILRSLYYEDRTMHYRTYCSSWIEGEHLAGWTQSCLEFHSISAQYKAIAICSFSVQEQYRFPRLQGSLKTRISLPTETVDTSRPRNDLFSLKRQINFKPRLLCEFVNF